MKENCVTKGPGALLGEGRPGWAGSACWLQRCRGLWSIRNALSLTLEFPVERLGEAVCSVQSKSLVPTASIWRRRGGKCMVEVGVGRGVGKEGVVVLSFMFETCALKRSLVAKLRMFFKPLREWGLLSKCLTLGKGLSWRVRQAPTQRRLGQDRVYRNH